MKKLITLVFALFLTAGMAYGQVDISVTQSGNNNDAVATMDGAGNVTDALITIDQSGNQNDAYSDQVMNSFSGDYESSITQTGNSNYADQFVGSSGHVTASITQIGNNNDAWQDISGAYTFTQLRLWTLPSVK